MVDGASVLDLVSELAHSVTIGIQNVLSDFEKSFRANNLKAVKDIPTLPLYRVLVPPVFLLAAGRSSPAKMKSRKLPTCCSTASLTPTSASRAVALGWHAIILTGGGSAMLYERLKPVLEHEKVILADDIESIHLANVRGGLKLWRLYEALKLV